MSEINQIPFSMKKLLFSFIGAVALNISIYAQVNLFSKQVFGKEVPTLSVAAPNLIQL